MQHTAPVAATFTIPLSSKSKRHQKAAAPESNRLNMGQALKPTPPTVPQANESFEKKPVYIYG
jgi:hypothetical protein